MTSLGTGGTMNERNDLVQSDNSETTAAPLQPMSFVDILDGMFSLYRQHFRLFVRIFSVYLVLGFAINLISVSAVIGATPVTGMIITIFTAVGSYLVSLFVVAGLVYASAQVYLSRDITFQEALQQARQRFLPFLGSTMLYYLVTICLSATIIGIPFAIYFGFRWGLFTLPVLFEETTARKALRRSTELVKGSWWRVFGIILAISLIAFMIAFILQTCYAIIFSSLTGSTGAEDLNFWKTIQRLFAPTPLDIGWVYYTIHTIGSLSIVGLTMPISVIGSMLLYFDLRIRKEAFDIEMQVTN
jgi:hypothetical protein